MNTDEEKEGLFLKPKEFLKNIVKDKPDQIIYTFYCVQMEDEDFVQMKIKMTAIKHSLEKVEGFTTTFLWKKIPHDFEEFFSSLDKAQQQESEAGGV